MTTVVSGAGGTTTVVVTRQEPNCCRAAIPAMHIGMAVFCLILNIFLPGWGTIIAGFSVFCCANPGASGGEKVGTLCINFWIGLLQMGTVWFFFLGWIWSIIWGAAFLGMSADYHKPQENVTVVTSAPPPQAQPIIITNNTMAGQQYPPPQQQYPPPQQQQYPPPQQQQYPPPQQQQGPPPAYDQPKQGGVPGEVQEHEL